MLRGVLALEATKVVDPLPIIAARHIVWARVAAPIALWVALVVARLRQQRSLLMLLGAR